VLGLRHRPGLTGRRLAATVAGGDRHDRAETDIGAAKAEGRRQLSAGARRWMPHVRFWSQFWSHSPTSGAVHGDRRPAVRAGQGRWRPMVDAHAQSSKACEGATLPWVQIPPPPPLTCKNAGPGSPQAGAPWSGSLILAVSLKSCRRATGGISRRCCAWSRAFRARLNEAAHALGAYASESGEIRHRPRSGNLRDRATPDDCHGVMGTWLSPTAALVYSSA